MQRNILCLAICALLCLALIGCASDKNTDLENDSPSVSVSLGENPEISITVGEVKRIAFKINTDEPVFQTDFLISISNSEVADAIYFGVLGDYVYYNLTAKAEGESSIYLEIPALNIKSDALTLKVKSAEKDKIYASLGENPVLTIAEGSSKTVCFYIGDNVMAEDVSVVITSGDFADVKYSYRSGAYFYYSINALKNGVVKFYTVINESGVQSETMTVNIVEKTNLPEYEETEEGFVCNINSKIFHKPNCNHAQKINDANKLIYPSNDSRQEIIDGGYTSCKTCNP